MFARIPLDANRAPALNVCLWPKGGYVAVNLSVLVTEIRTAPRMRYTERGAVAELLSDAHLSLPLRCSEITQ
jgi:hypothetical protein